MAFFTPGGPKKLPNFVTQEEFEQLFAAIQSLERKCKRKKRNKLNRLRQYRLALLLGFEGGLRISEVVGWPKGSIPRLKKENISEVSIKILGKGGKERVVPRPKRLSDKAIQVLIPLTVSRRALQKFITKLGDEVLHRHIGFHCVDTDTEVLTDSGWKKYNEIKKGELIFTFSLKKNIIELKPIKEVFIRKYQGEMYHIKNKYIDSLITSEHKIPLKICYKKKHGNFWDKLKLIKINEIKNLKCKINLNYKVSSVKRNGISIGLAKASILGWILSDGHISKRDNDITISQSLTANPNKCEIISKLLVDSGLRYYTNIQKTKISDYSKRKSKMIVFRIAKEGSEWIFDYINKDRTPKYNLLGLNYNELNAVYENMMLGDGTILRSNSREYSGQNKHRILFIRTLCSLLGKRTVIGIKSQRGKKYSRLYISNKDSFQLLEDKHISKENYNGIVWCPSTNNKTFIAKRNNSLFISGNTLRHGFGSHLAGQGRPLHEIQMLMGHTRLDTTGIYMHANPKIAVEKAREVF